MAIYHFSAKVISRAAGSSAVAAAAYRSASRLHDARLERSHDFTNKAGVVHSEVLLPEHAPDEWHDRERLWNDVEAAEKRKDAQLSREVEFAIPREMKQADGIELARDFVQREFVDRGMVADLNVHWDMGTDGMAKPHAHVMLSLREVSEEGFGAKVRDWNRTELLTHWRGAWAEHVNTRLAELDIDARVDHRSLEAQGIELEPQNKIGPAASRMFEQGLESERLDEHHAIARANGEKLLAAPHIALDAITHQQSTFTNRDLAMFVHRHSEGKDQFDQIMAVVRASPELVKLGKDGRGEDRFTSRAMLETEQRLERQTVRLDAERHHSVPDRHRDRALTRAEARGMVLSPEQRGAFEHVTDARGISSVIGYAGTGKSAMLGVAREAWHSAGYSVHGAALSGIAAENLEQGSGIASRTLASLEHQWGKERELLTSKSVLVIDEAGMIGTRQMERVMREAEKRGAKIVLVGDPEQLQAIEAGASFRSIAERHGAVEITAIRRQSEEWQREATRQLATGRTGEALAAYEDAGHVHAAETREAARANLIDRWDADRQTHPDASRIILTHTNDEVRELNEAARNRLRTAQMLGRDVGLTVERGERTFASGDRVMFLKNERSLGVKNGTLGTIEHVSAANMRVRTDDGRSVAFDIKDYAHVDHGYAATIHKSQGMTVDRVHVLATPGLDRHASYVALSRHRTQVDLHYGKDDFAERSRLVRALSRERGKDMVSDYTRAPEQKPKSEPAPTPKNEPEVRRNPFAGMRFKVQPEPSVQQSQPFDAAVARYGRALRDIDQMQRQRLNPIISQVHALDRAAKSLDAQRPHAAEDMYAAMSKDPSLIDEAAQGKGARAIQAMRLESEIRVAADERADRFIEEWQTRTRQFLRMQKMGDPLGAERAAERIDYLSKSFHRDPELESRLHRRSYELGFKPREGSTLSRDMQDWISRSRSRGLER
ncbi:Ti-type conjugative transfer relaxase TraA [Novosphingobium sp. MBES04]|uniref:Ti-type conjugative transfer relaxase TraA n=1 Tax=Novosphingobium sp. MBES04 TaxID=1206458 RepID=UPI0005806254|nr:Ti-type conjugative transfer relaxase TraA [Novosphingobium sp. MBES04]GAM04980.1 conjugal transfer protein TraA [Novosphingobium sp. MBES04]